MPFVLSERIQADLSLLAEFDTTVVQEFCSVCIDFIRRGVEKSVFARVGRTLGRSGEDISAVVMALTQTLLSAARYNVSEGELSAVLSDLPGLAETCRAVIVATYKKEGEKLVEHLKGHAVSGLPQYKHLDWRLEVTVASKWSHDVCAPAFALRLDTTGTQDSTAQTPPSLSSLHMTADYAALRRVAEALDEAAVEMKGAHSKRIIRYIH